MTEQRRQLLKISPHSAARWRRPAARPAPDRGTAAVVPRADGGGAGERYRWRLVTAWPPGLPGFGTTAVTLADTLREVSGGRLTLQVYAAGELVPAFEVFDAVSRGSVEMGHSAPAYWKGQAPTTQLFTGYPFGMLPAEFNAWMAYGGGMELWRECYEPYGLVPFPGGNTGARWAAWFAAKSSRGRLSGLKIRMPGLGGDVSAHGSGTGGQPAGRRVFTAALQSGLIDADRVGQPITTIFAGLYQAAPYYIFPAGTNRPARSRFIVNRRGAGMSLPGDLQKLIQTACTAVNHQMLSEFMARNVQSLRVLVEEHGVQLRRFPDDVLQGLRKAANEILDELGAENPLAGRILRSYREFQEGVSGWQAISEGSYLSARDS